VSVHQTQVVKKIAEQTVKVTKELGGKAKPRK
jgi:hypothetical protein